MSELRTEACLPGDCVPGTGVNPSAFFVICWTHRESGVEGQGSPVSRLIAEEYMTRHSPTLPEFEFTLRPAEAKELGPKVKTARNATTQAVA